LDGSLIQICRGDQNCNHVYEECATDVVVTNYMSNSVSVVVDAPYVDSCPFNGNYVDVMLQLSCNGTLPPGLYPLSPTNFVQVNCCAQI
jgi:hypothetical protein